MVCCVCVSYIKEIYIYLFIRLFTQEIEKNANELITEEEREKRKVEKRRAKKKVNTFNSI